MSLMDVFPSEIVSEELVPAREVTNLGESKIDFDGLLEDPLLVFEDGGASGCGGKLWPAGDLLSRYVIRHGVVGSRIVELGSGTGLVGLALAKAEKKPSDKKIWITDIDKLVPLMDNNIRLNKLEDIVEARILNWGEQLPDYLDGRVDTVLAADCVYLETAFPLLEKTLLDLCDSDTYVLMSYKKRRKADSRFFKAIKKNFQVIEIKDYEEYEMFHRQAVYLFQLKRKSPPNEQKKKQIQ